MPENRKLLLIGGGGHCKSVIDTLLTSSEYKNIGIIEKKNKYMAVSKISEIPVIGYDDELEIFYKRGYTDAFITVGSIGNPVVRNVIYKRIKEIGFRVPNIIDKSSNISKGIHWGEGIFAGKNVVINAEVQLGNCVIINTGSIIEHECRIQDFVHVGPGSIICGNVRIDEETHIGAGSIVKQGVHIGAGAMIGMGSVVLKDISSYATAYGNPCREVKNE